MGGIASDRLARALAEAERVGWSLLDGALDAWRDAARAIDMAFVPTRPGDVEIGELRAVCREQAHPASLSALVGLDAMPLHTDGACLREPPTFALLEAVKAVPGEETLLWPIGETDLTDDARHGVFAVVGRGRPFAAHAIDAAGRVRFDPGCMRPRDPMAGRVVAHFRERVDQAYRHCWASAPGCVLVIDNRRTLHGRTALRTDGGRMLRRLMLKPVP